DVPETPTLPSIPSTPDEGGGGAKVDTKIVSFSQDSGIKGDGITNDSRIDLQGTAAAKSTVKIYDGTKQIGTATADANGKWSYTTPTLTDGAHSLAALGADGAASSALAITVDTKA